MCKPEDESPVKKRKGRCLPFPLSFLAARLSIDRGHGVPVPVGHPQANFRQRWKGGSYSVRAASRYKIQVKAGYEQANGHTALDNVVFGGASTIDRYELMVSRVKAVT